MERPPNGIVDFMKANMNIKDVIMLLVILVGGFTTYYGTLNSTYAAILDNSLRTEQNSNRILDNEKHVKAQFDMLQQQLDKIDKKLDDISTDLKILNEDKIPIIREDVAVIKTQLRSF